MKKSMGWQPEQVDNRIGFTLGLIGGIWQFVMNIHLPLDFLSKLVEGAITAGVCGFAGIFGKELFVIARRSVIAYFKTRKPK